MKKIFIFNLFLLCYLIVVGLILFVIYFLNNVPGSNQTNFSPSESAPQTTSKRIALHCSIPYWEQKSAIESFKKNVDKFESISMFWYYVDSDLNIATYEYAEEDTSIISYAHEHNVKVLALITNLPDVEGSTWSSDRLRPILEHSDKRAEHIADIMQLLEEKGFDGVNVDYEELDDDLKDEYSTFIKELANAVHARGKIVGVAIHPKSGDNIPSEDNGSRAQDWQALGRYADQLYFMTHGEHWDESEAGPPASIPWDNKIIDYAKQLDVPLEKIYFGIPLYGMKWKSGEKNGEGVLYRDVKDLIQQYQVQTLWNEEAQSPYFRYTEDGNNYEVWYEDARSVAAKLNLAKENNLGGVTLWHIGGEDSEIWKKF